jgi:DNA repair exonuclease SbcCD ATPase subunit
MVSSSTIETLRESLRSEQSQLEAWVRDSMAAMDGLHAELAEWERDLTRRESDVERRESELRQSTSDRETEVAAELRLLRRLIQRQGDALDRHAKAVD